MCSMGAPAFLFRAWKLDCEVDMKTLDVVALVKDCPEEGLRRGQVGTVVDAPSPGVYLVEFADIGGEPYAFLMAPETDLLVLHHRPALKVA